MDNEIYKIVYNYKKILEKEYDDININNFEPFYNLYQIICDDIYLFMAT